MTPSNKLELLFVLGGSHACYIFEFVNIMDPICGQITHFYCEWQTVKYSKPTGEWGGLKLLAVQLQFTVVLRHSLISQRPAEASRVKVNMLTCTKCTLKCMLGRALYESGCHISTFCIEKVRWTRLEM